MISATTDDPAADTAFEDVDWPDELTAQDEHNQYLIAELDGRPIGTMQIIDPHQESTHYWGKIRPNLRALDIWIGEPDCLGKGYGEAMMRLAFQLCLPTRRLRRSLSIRWRATHGPTSFAVASASSPWAGESLVTTIASCMSSGARTGELRSRRTR